MAQIATAVSWPVSPVTFLISSRPFAFTFALSVVVLALLPSLVRGNNKPGWIVMRQIRQMGSQKTSPPLINLNGLKMLPTCAKVCIPVCIHSENTRWGSRPTATHAPAASLSIRHNGHHNGHHNGQCNNQLLRTWTHVDRAAFAPGVCLFGTAIVGFRETLDSADTARIFPGICRPVPSQGPRVTSRSTAAPHRLKLHLWSWRISP